MTRIGLSTSALTLIAGLTLAGTAAAQSSQPPGKLKKQIEVMERILDEMLVDSKNVLVSGHDVTRGVYVPEFGVIFTLEAGILGPDHGEWWKNVDWSKKFKINTKDGTTIVSFNNDDDDEDKEDKKDKEEREMTRKELMKDRQERYERSKTELKLTLVDYGETLTGLRDDQWVGIAAFFDNDYFDERSTDTVIIKAKMSDLRAHSAGTVSDQQMASRVTIEEY